MSRRTVFSCDWCERDSTVNEARDYAPEDWEDHDGELLCVECVGARMGAINIARAKRHPSSKPQETT